MTPPAALLAYLVAAMSSWVTPHPEDVPRYEAIASDVIVVTYDDAETPLYAGDDGRIKTALEILAIASLESNYRADVDDGRVRGDHGASSCLMQIQLPGSSRIALTDDGTFAYAYGEGGYAGSDLTKDRRLCIRTGLHVLRHSHRKCHDLSGYTSGTCDPAEPRALYRQRRAHRYLATHPFAGTQS